MRHAWPGKNRKPEPRPPCPDLTFVQKDLLGKVRTARAACRSIEHDLRGAMRQSFRQDDPEVNDCLRKLEVAGQKLKELLKKAQGMDLREHRLIQECSLEIPGFTRAKEFKGLLQSLAKRKNSEGQGISKNAQM